MSDEELAELEEWAKRLWPIHSLMPRFEKLLAEVWRLKRENENLAGELRDEKAYAKELRDNMGQAGIY